MKRSNEEERGEEKRSVKCNRHEICETIAQSTVEMRGRERRGEEVIGVEGNRGEEWSRGERRGGEKKRG